MNIFILLGLCLIMCDSVLNEEKVLLYIVWKLRTPEKQMDIV